MLPTLVTLLLVVWAVEAVALVVAARREGALVRARDAEPRS